MSKWLKSSWNHDSFIFLHADHKFTNLWVGISIMCTVSITLGWDRSFYGEGAKQVLGNRVLQDYSTDEESTDYLPKK